MKTQIYDMLDAAKNDYDAVAREVYKGEKKLALYLIQTGLETIASQRRADIRKVLKRTIIKPEFVRRPGGVKHSVKLSDRFNRRLVQATVGLVRNWKIGKVDLADFTKLSLIAAAQAERASGKGHVRNALFYEALAAPMNEVETVEAHWKSPESAALIRDEIWNRDVEFLQAAE